MAESFGENSLEKGPEFNYQNYEAAKLSILNPVLGFMICTRLHQVVSDS